MTVSSTHVSRVGITHTYDPGRPIGGSRRIADGKTEVHASVKEIVEGRWRAQAGEAGGRACCVWPPHRCPTQQKARSRHELIPVASAAGSSALAGACLDPEHSGTVDKARTSLHLMLVPLACTRHASCSTCSLTCVKVTDAMTRVQERRRAGFSRTPLAVTGSRAAFVLPVCAARIPSSTKPNSPISPSSSPSSASVIIMSASTWEASAVAKCNRQGQLLQSSHETRFARR